MLTQRTSQSKLFAKIEFNVRSTGCWSTCPLTPRWSAQHSLSRQQNLHSCQSKWHPSIRMSAHQPECLSCAGSWPWQVNAQLLTADTLLGHDFHAFNRIFSCEDSWWKPATRWYAMHAFHCPSVTPRESAGLQTIVLTNSIKNFDLQHTKCTEHEWTTWNKQH